MCEPSLRRPGIVSLPAALFLLAVSVGAPSVAAGVPNVIEAVDTSRDAPAWISATAATTPAGLNPAYFAAHELRMLQALVERAAATTPGSEMPDDGCASWITTTIDREDQRANGSLRHLSHNANAVYVGTVTDVEQGFLYGTPGSLLEVEIERSLKFPAGEPPSKVLVFFQFARITVGDVVLCAKSERGEVSPAPGARILVFAYRGLGKSPSEVIHPDDEEIFFEQAAGGVSLPRSIEELPEDISFDELVEAVDRIGSTGR